MSKLNVKAIAVAKIAESWFGSENVRALYTDYAQVLAEWLAEKPTYKLYRQADEAKCKYETTDPMEVVILMENGWWLDTVDDWCQYEYELHYGIDGYSVE